MSNKRRMRAQAAQEAARRRRLRPIKVGVALAVVVLGGALLFGNAFRGRDSTGSLGPSLGMSLFGGKDLGYISDLPPPGPNTRVPINYADPFSGKPHPSGGPTVTHKGYVIGFCCAESYTKWNPLSERERDAVVRGYLR
jgi:hypothetical protein